MKRNLGNMSEARKTVKVKKTVEPWAQIKNKLSFFFSVCENVSRNERQLRLNFQNPL